MHTQLQLLVNFSPVTLEPGLLYQLCGVTYKKTSEVSNPLTTARNYSYTNFR
jgi:hypothetical protein